MDAQSKTKNEATAAICDLLGIPPLSVTVGSSVPKQLFVALALRFGLDPAPAMPEIGRAVASAAGLPWAAECSSTGSTVTLNGLTTILSATRLLVGADPQPPSTSPIDARNRVLGEIVRRRGQPAFRQALLRAYDSRCAVTGCSEDSVLEAAHIRPYMGTHSNVLSNGLLLRSDIHTLFDLRKVSVDPVAMRVWVHPSIMEDYRLLEGRRLTSPGRLLDAPDTTALREHHRGALAESATA